MTKLANALIVIALLGILTACESETAKQPTGASIPNIASGHSEVVLKRADQAFRLNHMKAVKFVDLDGSEQLRLFFSEEAFGDVVVTDFFGDDEIRDWAIVDRNTLRDVIDLRVSYADPHSGYEGMIYPTDALNANGKSAFAELTLDAGRISGELDFQDSFAQFNDGNAAWEVKGSFSGPVTVVSKPEPVRGKAILDAPQIATLNRMIEAMRDGDAQAMRELSTPKANELLDMLIERMGEEQAVAYMGGAADDFAALPEAFEAGKGELYNAGERALLQVIEEGDGFSSKVSVRFLWKDGRWLMN